VALSPGTRLGSHEVVALLGSGGMGEVYRARDLKLNRAVAVKTLPEAFSLDADRIARFKREAQVLASLNHPNIAAIHGFEESNGVQVLVLELVEGPTLADRIAHGSIPLDEALPIARQIAEALGAAHEQGIIHRDLKPANIKLRPDGTAKVLDFGLAKALEPSVGVGAGVTASPTITTPAMTRMGVILGTAAYMSPEQAKGRPADKRSDVWAFGCVLYEMLTGKRPFDGEDVTDTVATVLKGEPDWSALPPEVPPQIRLLLKRCLEKDRRARVSDISIARFLTTETIPPAAGLSAEAQSVPVRHPGLITWAIAGLLIGAALTATATWTMFRLAPAAAPRVIRFSIAPPAAQPLSVLSTDRVIAISPDGTHIVYRSNTGHLTGQLMVRALDELESRPLAGINNARAPFISPDGRWVGFFDLDGLKKVSIAGGPPILLCSIGAGSSRGASWGPDGTIVFATSDTMTGLLSVPAGAGKPKALTTPDREHGEINHWFPSVLPGGHAVLFTVSRGGSIEDAQVAVVDLKTGRHKTLVRGGTSAEYVDTGHLVYAAAGALRAVRFDLARLEVVGDPVPVVEQLMMTPTGGANFAVSRTGSLVFLPATARALPTAPRSLVWVDRQGREEPLKAPPREYAIPRLSPDGTRIALDIRDQASDIWIWDLRRQTMTRLTSDPNSDQSPVWTPDGAFIVWTASQSAGIPNLYRQSADGAGAVERLTTSPFAQFPTSISADASRLVLFEGPGGAAYAIGAITLKGSSIAAASRSSAAVGGQYHVEQLIHPIPASALNPEVSPDGRWLAYQSNESGQDEIYVRPFPSVDDGRWLVSTAGGSRPAWARRGRELFYLDRNDLLTAVLVQTTGSTFKAADPRKLLETRYYAGASVRGVPLRGYDVSLDGQRFLMIKEDTGASATGPQASLVVIENWFEELKQRVPTK
jgi:Tol biopolymer transport system component